MNNNESIDDFLARKEREKEEKKSYDQGFVSLKLKRSIANKMDKVIEYNKDKEDKDFKRGEMISQLLDFYIFMVMDNDLTEDQAKRIFTSTKETQRMVTRSDENNQVMLHLLLGIFQNIGLQSLGEHGKDITEFVDDLSEKNGSTELLSYIKGKISDEKHAEKLKRR